MSHLLTIRSVTLKDEYTDTDDIIIIQNIIIKSITKNSL